MKLSNIIIKGIDLIYLPVFRRVVPKDIFRYGVCGVANMCLDLVFYYFVFHYLLFDGDLSLGCVTISGHIASMLIVFPITFFNGFWLNKYVAFRSSSKRKTWGQLLRYSLSVVGSILLNYVCLKFFVDFCDFYPTPSKALTTAISVVYSYLMQRFFTFK